jgi:glycosyltransferase involved in cell wall biosynthesis
VPGRNAREQGTGRPSATRFVELVTAIGDKLLLVADPALCSAPGMADRSAVVISPGRPGEGGQGGSAAQFAFGLRERGWAVDYVSLPDEPGLLRRLVNLRMARVPGRLERWTNIREVRSAVPDGWQLAYAMPGFLPRRRSGPAVLHQATHAPDVVVQQMHAARGAAGGGKTFMTAGEARHLTRELMSAELVRTYTSTVRDELHALGLPDERIVHAPPGVRLDRFMPGERRTSALSVAFVGAMSLWKGIDILVELTWEVHRRGGTVDTIGGPVCRWSRRLADSADFTRHPDDVARLLGSAHALVLPSASDGFGYVVLEAMAAGCVPFVSPAVGAAELVTQIDPRLVVPRDVFAESVPDLLWSLPLPELGRRARTIAEAYEWHDRARAAADTILARLGLAATDRA